MNKPADMEYEEEQKRLEDEAKENQKQFMLALINFAGVVAILVGSLFVGRFFYLKFRGKPTGLYEENEFGQLEDKYEHVGQGGLMFVLAFLVSSYVGIFLIWVPFLNLFL